MRWTFALATTACLLWAASIAQAQTGPNSRRSLMAAPDAPASSASVRRVAATRYQEPQPAQAATPAEPASPSDARPMDEAAGIEGSGYQSMHDVYQAPRPFGWDGFGGNCAPANPWCEDRPYDDCGNGDCCDSGCYSFLGYGCAPRCGWFGSLGGIAMTRDRGHEWWTTFETANPVNQLMHSQQARADWRGGGEFSVGRYFCCGQNAIAFTYWATDAMEGFSSFRDPANGISTPINLFNVTLGGAAATTIFDNAREHRISRHDEIHNLELNLWRYSAFAGDDQSLQLNFFTGVRFFRFDETLQFSSVAGGFEFGNNAGVQEGYLTIRDENNLVGWQIGTRINWFITPKLAAYATPTFGIFGNHIQQRVHLYRGDGIDTFDLASSKVDATVMGAIDLGLTWNFARNWSAYGGYRAVGFSGVAQGDDQIPAFLIDSADILDIGSNSGMIVHGATFGLQWNF